MTQIGSKHKSERENQTKPTGPTKAQSVGIKHSLEHAKVGTHVTSHTQYGQQKYQNRWTHTGRKSEVCEGTTGTGNTGRKGKRD